MGKDGGDGLALLKLDFLSLRKRSSSPGDPWALVDFPK